jgi:hypothetical protein
VLNGTNKGTLFANEGIRRAGIPELDRIAADPRCLAGLSKRAITALLLRTSVVQSALTAALAAEDPHEPPAAIITEDDRMLTIDEAAGMLRKSRQWFYRHESLPFIKRISRKSLLCSEIGMKRWLASRKA